MVFNVQNAHPDELSEKSSGLGAGFGADSLGGFLDSAEDSVGVALAQLVAVGVLEDDGAPLGAFRAWNNENDKTNGSNS